MYCLLTGGVYAQSDQEGLALHFMRGMAKATCFHLFWLAFNISGVGKLLGNGEKSIAKSTVIKAGTALQVSVLE